MAKLNIKNAGKYSSNGASEYFMLKDDGDTARVRFLYDDPDGADIDFFLVHTVEIQGKKRYVACNAVDDEGKMHKDDCPLCKSGNRPQEKLFLQLYDEDEEKLKIWERGKNFVPKIVSFINRYGALVAQAFDIERHGRKGDTNTTYELYACKQDDKVLEDFPEKQELEGTLIIKASIDDMYDMLDGVYTTGEQEQQKQQVKEEEPVRRRQRGGREEEPEQEQPRRRRRDRSENNF